MRRGCATQLLPPIGLLSLSGLVQPQLCFPGARFCRQGHGRFIPGTDVAPI